jgi:hypothetical protein
MYCRLKTKYILIIQLTVAHFVQSWTKRDSIKYILLLLEHILLCKQDKSKVRFHSKYDPEEGDTTDCNIIYNCQNNTFIWNQDQFQSESNLNAYISRKVAFLQLYIKNCDVTSYSDTFARIALIHKIHWYYTSLLIKSDNSQLSTVSISSNN